MEFFLKWNRYRIDLISRFYVVFTAFLFQTGAMNIVIKRWNDQ